ncbi:hypothetical protein [Nocardia sp. CNY236]|uniref:hypothetical protein n=1 Tax=Nocardia sp. CNY236 TaxID=1169152 RepID=UPI0004282078|nr:hypothetical protein [Nocardia sp. CNY236]
MSTELHDLWRHQYNDCALETAPTSLEQARFVLCIHRGHGGECLQARTASAYIRSARHPQMSLGDPIGHLHNIDGSWSILGADGWCYDGEEYADLLEEQAIDRAHDILER